MGMQSLQDFADGSLNFLAKFNIVKQKANFSSQSNIFVVHGDSCYRLFYPEITDWICGGQWSELLQNIERFVRTFKQAGSEVVVFLDGSINDEALFNWKNRNSQVCEFSKEVLDQMLHRRDIRPKASSKKFVLPAALKFALRLAFRACEVTVCSSIDDVFQESILYCKDESCNGIIAKDAHYFVYHAQSYLYSDIKIMYPKKVVSNLKAYRWNEILDSLGMSKDMIPVFVTLLGGMFLSHQELSSFYWDLIADDSPLKKAKENMNNDSVLPPAEMRLKCVAKFLGTQDLDLDALAVTIFKNCSILSFEEAKNKFQKGVNFYQEKSKIAHSKRCTQRGANSTTSLSGFPVKQVVEQEKKKSAKEETKKSSQITKVDEAEKTSSDTMSDPEKIIKEGTLEEAAEALEALELKETAERKDGQEKKEASKEEKPSSDSNADSNESTEHSKTSEEYQESKDDEGIDFPREIELDCRVEGVSDKILSVCRKRHQCGQMCPEIINLLTKGEILIDTAIDDWESPSHIPPIPLIYRPLRQFIYGVLFKDKIPESLNRNEEIVQNGVSEEEEKDEKKLVNGGEAVEGFTIREWCVSRDGKVESPDHVTPHAMSWGIPSLERLWLGLEPEDNANRLKTFLSCMRSDTVNMSNTAMVPQRLLLLCCTLRYLIQQEGGKSIVTRSEIDAFIAQALSPHLTTECNVQNLANIKLTKLDRRGVHLASIFMSGVEAAIIANDACGSPVPWEYCCPWNFFDGKLFHSKYLQAKQNVSTTELCDGKPQTAEKLERMRWCITEGLEAKYDIVGLNQSSSKMFSPFDGDSPGRPSPYYNMQPAGVRLPMGMGRGGQRSRGPGSKQVVHGSGGTLQVAGVPVAHWGGNKQGLGYTKNGPGVVVGGPTSVDLPSRHPRSGYRGRGGGRRGSNQSARGVNPARGGVSNRGLNSGRGVNSGRGILETPLFSTWIPSIPFGTDDFLNSSYQTSHYQQYMSGVQKAQETRSKVGKMRPQLYNSKPRHHPTANGLQPKQVSNSLWLGRGRGQLQGDSPKKKGKSKEVDKVIGHGRGQWTGFDSSS